MNEIMYYVVNTRTNQTLFSSPLIVACTLWINQRYTESHPDWEYIFIQND